MRHESSPSPSPDDRLTALLRPRSVAVLGASAKRTASGNHVLRNLQSAGYAGDVFVVHPAAPVIEGLQAVPHIGDLPGDVDAAVVCLPPANLLDALRELEAAGCRSALVPTVGLDRATGRAVAEVAARRVMAVHGPNCMGIINLTDGVPLWIDTAALAQEPAGPVALVSQSGSAALFIARSAGSTRFSKILSTGDESGATTADYLSWLADDPATTAAGIVVESIRDVPAFAAAVARMRVAGKPVVVLRVGRSPVGSATTTAHTGALIGSDAGYRALFESLDLPVVADYDEMASVLECFAVPGLPRAAGRRVGVVTLSGGQAALSADLAAEREVRTAAFTDATRKRLEEAMPGTEGRNPFDAGASVQWPEGGYEQAIDLLLADENTDSVMVVLDGQATLADSEIDYEADEFSAARRVAERGPAKPLVIASSSSVSIHPECENLVGAAVPVLRGIGNALVALRSLAANRRPVPEAPTRLAGLPSSGEVAELRGEALLAAGTLPEVLARRILSAYGLPLVDATVVATAEEALEWAEQRFPVVAKISSPDIAHRSDVGGVAVALADPHELTQALERIAADVTRARPDADLRGFEIQRQITGGREAVLGFVADPALGPIVTCGSGGTLVELLADTSTALAPLGRSHAARLIEGTRLGTLLAGYRNLAPVTDTGPLADALHRLSWLAADFAGVLSECDLNPALVEDGSGRVHIVDALLVAHPPRGADEQPEVPSQDEECLIS